MIKALVASSACTEAATLEAAGAFPGAAPFCASASTLLSMATISLALAYCM